jgi:hypothetical protein
MYRVNLEVIFNILKQNGHKWFSEQHKMTFQDNIWVNIYHVSLLEPLAKRRTWQSTSFP